jgi:RNase adaptor protein for sRNA GlmZ degradation
MVKKITLVSFGFKYGIPNANYYFDVGFIKNPAREARWGFFSEPTDEMREFILQQEKVKEFLKYIVPLIEFLSTVDQNQIFAFGCSAGRHRSSILVDVLASKLKNMTVRVNHRDSNGRT